MMVQNDKKARPFRIYVLIYMETFCQPTCWGSVFAIHFDPVQASGVPVVTPLAVNG